MDSTGGYVSGRSMGREHGVGVPDFLVVKATLHLDGDIALVVIEVKRKNESTDNARVQIRRYLNLLKPKAGRHPRLLGLLILGATTEVSTLRDGTHDTDIVEHPSVLTAQAPFLQLLHDIAILYP
jgi:hypothetical protein